MFLWFNHHVRRRGFLAFNIHAIYTRSLTDSAETVAAFWGPNVLIYALNVYLVFSHQENAVPKYGRRGLKAVILAI